jgi:hypothetical protein
VVTNSEYSKLHFLDYIDHVAMVLRSSSEEISLFEANSEDVILKNCKLLGCHINLMELIHPIEIIFKPCENGL